MRVPAKCQPFSSYFSDLHSRTILWCNVRCRVHRVLTPAGNLLTNLCYVLLSHGRAANGDDISKWLSKIAEHAAEDAAAQEDDDDQETDSEDDEDEEGDEDEDEDEEAGSK